MKRLCAAAILLLTAAVTGQIVASKPAAKTRIEDGPHLFHQKDGSVEAVWIERGKKKTRHFKKGAPIELAGFAGLLGKSLVLPKHTPDAAVLEMPKKLLAISDVEGEYDDLVRFLRANKVIDEKNHWAFGVGHLVTVGDMVDRGSKVTEVLWLMYRLSFEARKAGGRVHFVLGNHEAMVMGGDIRYIAPKYHKVCEILGLTYPQLVGADTEIGRWLRARNSVVRIGKMLFVHAGISPTLKIEGKDLPAFNARMRKTLGIEPQKLVEQIRAETDKQKATIATEALQLAWGTRGPYWYRGYFPTFARTYPQEFGPRPSTAEVDAILGRLGAKTIVIGHTKVTQPSFIYDRRRVLAIDTPWTDMPNVRGVWVEGPRMAFVDVQGKKKWLPEAKGR